MKIKASKVKILVTGDSKHPDFSDAMRSLPPETQIVELDACDPIADSPDLLLMVQARRNQIPLDIGKRLLAKWPNTPAVQLLSTWSEGENRSGKPLPGWVRVAWHRWSLEFERFVQARESGRPTSWDRARVNGERTEMGPPPWTGGRCLDIGVFSRWNSEGAMIEQMLTALGHSVRRPNESPSAKHSRPLDACLIVGDACDRWLEESLTAAHAICRKGLKIVIMNFPRPHDSEQLRLRGGRHVALVAKPFEVAHVQHLLQSFAPGRASKSSGGR